MDTLILFCLPVNCGRFKQFLMWLLPMLSAFILGLSRGGLKGINSLSILLMAMTFGARNAAGIIVPLLIIGDLFALHRYGKYIQKKYVLEFLPPVFVGALIGVWIGKDMPEFYFKKVLAILIVLGMVVMGIWDFYWKTKIEKGKAFIRFLGLGAGFYAILGNFAGAFANIYFLLTRLPKNELIGTGTFLFFLINLLKMPFHIFIWETISLQTFETGMYLIPAVIIGFFVGVKAVAKINDNQFRQFLYVVTILGAILVFFN